MTLLRSCQSVPGQKFAKASQAATFQAEPNQLGLRARDVITLQRKVASGHDADEETVPREALPSVTRHFDGVWAGRRRERHSPHLRGIHNEFDITRGLSSGADWGIRRRRLAPPDPR